MLLWTGGKWIEGLPAELKQLSAPLLFSVRDWLVDDNSGGIYGLAAGKDGV